mgnify:CR=1
RAFLWRFLRSGESKIDGKEYPADRVDPSIGGRYVQREVQEWVPQVWVVVNQGDEERRDRAALHCFDIDAKEAAENESEDVDVTSGNVVC